MKKTIVIVDDHVLIANALSTIISGFEDFEVIYTAENGEDLQDKIKMKGKPDLVLLDISMPVMDGFETANWLKDTYPDVLIMALSMQDDESSLIKMIKNGAKGYMLKNVYPTDLEKALKAIVADGRFFPEWASSKIFESIGSDKNMNKEKIKLSEREVEFLKYTVTEMNYRQISEKMFCSPRTIENYRDSLFTKLDLKTRVGLAVYALKNGYSD